MGMCDNLFATLGRDEFYEHVRKEVSVVADNIATHIQFAIREDAEEYQNNSYGDSSDDYSGGNPNDPNDLEWARENWNRYLGVDIATVNFNGAVISDEIRNPITDYVHQQLQPLKDRAKSLPKPSDAEALMTTVKERLYGVGYANGDNAAEGVLGEVEMRSASIRTDDLASWDSGASKVYKTKFLDNMESVVVPKQRQELNTLAHLAELNYGTVLTAREDICRIVHAAATAAEDMNDGCGHGTDGGLDDGPGVGAYVGMGLALAAVAAACAPGTAILGIAVAVAGTGGAAIPFFESQDGPKPGTTDGKEERSFAAAHWQELIEKVADAAYEMTVNLDDCNAAISDAADRRLDMVTGKDRDRFYVVNSGA